MRNLALISVLPKVYDRQLSSEYYVNLKLSGIQKILCFSPFTTIQCFLEVRSKGVHRKRRVFGDL